VCIVDIVLSLLTSVNAVHSLMIRKWSEVLVANCLMRGSTLWHCFFVPTNQVMYSDMDWSLVLITLCVICLC
jgi:hypothetical protein